MTRRSSLKTKNPAQKAGFFVRIPMIGIRQSKPKSHESGGYTDPPLQKGKQVGVDQRIDPHETKQPASVPKKHGSWLKGEAKVLLIIYYSFLCTHIF